MHRGKAVHFYLGGDHWCVLSQLQIFTTVCINLHKRCLINQTTAHLGFRTVHFTFTPCLKWNRANLVWSCFIHRNVIVILGLKCPCFLQIQLYRFVLVCLIGRNASIWYQRLHLSWLSTFFSLNTHLHSWTQTHIHIDIPCSVFSMVSRRSVFIFFTLLHNCVFPPSFTQLCVRNVNSLEMNEWVFLSVWEKVNYCKTAEICVTLALSCFYVHSPTQQSSVKACFHR